MDRRLEAGCVGLLGAILAGCQQATPQEDAQSKIQGCANEAAEFLDPHWRPQQVTGTYPDPNGGIEAVIVARGVRVTVNCNVDAGYYMHVLGPVALVAGDPPQPGQFYLPMQHRWLTDAELKSRMVGMLARARANTPAASGRPTRPPSTRSRTSPGSPAPRVSCCRASWSQRASWWPARSRPATAIG